MSILYYMITGPYFAILYGGCCAVHSIAILHSVFVAKELHQGLGQQSEALIAWEAAASLNPESSSLAEPFRLDSLSLLPLPSHVDTCCRYSI